MLKLKARMFAAVSALLVSAVGAHATPTFDYFGALPEATFDGTGIPNDAVAVSQLLGDDFVLTLGLTAHQRFENHAVGNDGAGTFFATPGLNFGDPNNPDAGPSQTAGATWNFGFYIGLESETQTFASLFDNLALFEISLAYDFDPSDGIDQGALILNDILRFEANGAGVLQSSQNLAFEFLSASNFNIYPPQGSFDPFANGLYSLSLQAVGSGTFTTAGIDVQVANGDAPTAVSEPATLGLLGLGLIGLAAARRRRA